MSGQINDWREALERFIIAVKVGKRLHRTIRDNLAEFQDSMRFLINILTASHAGFFK